MNLCVLLVLILPQATPGRGGDPVAKIRKLFESYDFTHARAQAKKLRGGETDLAPQSRRELLRIEAFSDFYLEDRAGAEALLSALFAEEPDATIDPHAHPPQLVAFFTAVKAKVAAKKPSPSSNAASRPAETEAAAPFNPLSLLPFGIGQLAQRDFVAGSLWLTADALLFAGNLATHFILHAQRQPNGLFVSPPRANALQISENALGAALIASTVLGIFDSVFLSPRRVRGRMPKISAAWVSDGRGQLVSLVALW